MSKEPDSNVEYSKAMAVLGMITGIFVAFALPVLVMIVGSDLEPESQRAIMVASIVMGGAIVIVSVFVGTVIPSRVNRGKKQPGDAKGDDHE